MYLKFKKTAGKIERLTFKLKHIREKMKQRNFNQIKGRKKLKRIKEKECMWETKDSRRPYHNKCG